MLAASVKIYILKWEQGGKNIDYLYQPSFTYQTVTDMLKHCTSLKTIKLTS